MMQRWVFLQAQDECSLSFVSGLAGSRHPYQSLKIPLLSEFGGNSDLQGGDGFGRVLWRHAVTITQQMDGDRAFGEAIAHDRLNVARQRRQRRVGQNNMSAFE